MSRYSDDTIKKLLAVLLVIIMAGMVGQAVYIVTFNQKEHVVAGADEEAECYLDLHTRDDSTSRWLKRDFDLDGETVDLKAQTYDAVFYNNSADQVESWKVVIGIQEDCFINNAWCGTVEIHQFVGTDRESSQTLDLRDYKEEDVTLKHLYDGDLLIPLQKGDYLVYYPSEKDRELQIAPGSEVTIGMIFYYLHSLDLHDYKLNYHQHKNFTEGVGFFSVAALAALWLVLFGGRKVAQLSYRRALKDAELRRSGIACMSDLYSVIYFIDLEKDELQMISASDESERRRPRNLSARAQLLNMFRQDADDAYTDIMQEFGDIRTLGERMERNTIACDYLSKEFGWSRIRFFAMDRGEGEPLKKVIFTIQDINDEKEELEEFEDRVSEAEMETRAKSTFLSGISNRLQTPISTIMDLDEKILAESRDEAVTGYAKQIRNAGKILSFMVEGALDSSRLAAGDLTLETADYSFRQLITDVCGIAKGITENEHLTFSLDVSPAIPERLVGDSGRIRQILINLLANSAHYTEEGSVMLSVYGKAAEGREHLLFSVKDTGIGISDEEKQSLTEYINSLSRENTRNTGGGQGLEMVAELLHFMGSSLHVVTETGEGTEFYFELEQDIADPAPVGVIDI